MKTSILVVDDDQKLNRNLRKYLLGFGFSVETSSDSVQALESAIRKSPKLIILDVMMPGLDGFEFCKKLRAHVSIPVIFLTARGDVNDRIVGLELGADDYLAKPFEPRELVARIKAVLRRKQGQSNTVHLHFGPLEIDSDRKVALINGKDAGLTTGEFGLIELFAKCPGQVLDRDYILDHLKGYSWEAFDRSVDVFISRIRQKLGDSPKGSKFFKTIWGTGYMFIGHELSEGDANEN